jgi:glycosyltransferase involved in cell wall biosynthesis
MTNDQKSRVVYLTENVGGGTGNHLLSMIKRWDAARWQAEIVTQNPVSARVEPDPTISVECVVKNRWYHRYPLGQLARLKQISRYLTENRPAVVHSYFFWSIIYGRVLKRLGKIPVLVENREDQGFDWGKKEYALLRLTRDIPDRVICVSKAVRDVVLERERLGAERVVVVHNGLDLETVVTNDDASSIRFELGIEDGDLVVGMVANMNRAVKGVTFLLDAIPLIVKVVPSARFVLLGRGREEQSLKDKAKALGIESHVIFAGFRRDVGRCYEEMDVSVLTSLSEGLSITLLESMSHGLPVVATHVGGNPEVVVEGETGYLVPPRNTEAFADRVVRLLLDPILRNRMGENGRSRIAERFDLRKVAPQYLEIYRELVGIASGASGDSP